MSKNDSNDNFEFSNKFASDISDVRKGENQIYTLIDAIPVAIAVNDEQGNILYLNHAFIQNIGYTLDDIPDLEHWWPLAYPDERYRDQVKRAWQTSLSSARESEEAYSPVEVDIRCRDDIVRTFLISPSALGHSCELSELHLVVLSDITNRKFAEAKIQRIAKLYRALSEINQAIVRMETEETLFPLICRMAVDYGGMALASIRQLNPETMLLEPVENYGIGAEYLKYTIISSTDQQPEGLGPAGIAFREGQNVIINDFPKNALTKPWHDQARIFGWGSSGSFPIMRNGLPFAILGVYHKDENAFDKESIDLLDEMVRDISFSLDSFDREKERQQIRNALLANERHFRAYFDRAMVGMAATSLHTGTWREVNEALCTMLGYPKEELMQKKWDDVTHPDDLEASRQAVASILNGEVDEFELNKRYVRQDGHIIHAHIASRVVRNEYGLADYLVTIVNDISEIKNHQDRLEHLVYHDPLTGLPNRVLLNEQLDNAVEEAKKTGDKIAVCFMDLDNFKPINDSYGHTIGDQILIEVARRLTPALSFKDFVARFGGDEFVFILNKLLDENDCKLRLSRITEAFDHPFLMDQYAIKLSASIGVAMYPDNITDGSSLLRHADQAMYLAKQTGRQRIHFFDVIDDHIAQVRSEGVLRVELAMRNNELILYYQPKINMKTGELIGMEALIRWQHPERGLLAAGEFMPLVENSSFEITLSEWVISQGMSQMHVWQALGLSFPLSINVSAKHLQSQGFVDYVLNEISKYPHFRKYAISFEILETAALGDMDLAIRKMHDCIHDGISFSIDDFGTGYASLAYLRRLPVDTIKIDQSFIRDMLYDANDLSIVQGVISLADAFQKKVIAEGVETIEHGVRLLQMGCNLGQGYAIARPMHPEHVTGWMNTFKLPQAWKDFS